MIVHRRVGDSTLPTRLKGHFSRLDYQARHYYQRPAEHILASLTLHLPAGIRDVYYYDVVGNVSTSRLRIAPVSPRPGATTYSVLELRPRYPMVGGWNYNFTLGWDAPLRDSARWDAQRQRYIIGIPVLTAIPGAVFDDVEVSVILPEGATFVFVISVLHSCAERKDHTLGKSNMYFHSLRFLRKWDCKRRIWTRPVVPSSPSNTHD